MNPKEPSRGSQERDTRVPHPGRANGQAPPPLDPRQSVIQLSFSGGRIAPHTRGAHVARPPPPRPRQSVILEQTTDRRKRNANHLQSLFRRSSLHGLPLTVFPARSLLVGRLRKSSLEILEPVAYLNKSMESVRVISPKAQCAFVLLGILCVGVDQSVHFVCCFAMSGLRICPCSQFCALQLV